LDPVTTVPATILIWFHQYKGFSSGDDKQKACGKGREIKKLRQWISEEKSKRDGRKLIQKLGNDNCALILNIIDETEQ